MKSKHTASADFCAVKEFSVVKAGTALAAAVLAILSLAGCAQQSMIKVHYPGPFAQEGQSGPPTFRKEEIDGGYFNLAEYTITDGGKRVTCRQYVERVQRDFDQPEHKTTVEVGDTCNPSSALYNQPLPLIRSLR
jgi:hypothetical protein